MKYKTEAVCSIELMTMTALPEERIFNDMFIRLMSDLPNDIKRRLVDFEHIDPFSQESTEKLRSPFCPDFTRNEILELRQRLIHKFSMSFKEV